MKKVLINYADDKFKNAQKQNTKSAYKHGFDQVIEYSPQDIDLDFFSKHKDIWSIKRGNGLWLWKPYFLLKTLKKLNDGDILFYLDSGAFWIKNAKPIFKLIEEEKIYVTDTPLIEKQFTKKIVFQKMDCMEEKYYVSNQIQSGFIGLKKNEYTVNFAKEWLKLCEDEEMLNPSILNEGIDETFYAHREDQSLLSLLCKKNNIKAHLDPTQYGKLPNKFDDSKFIIKTPAHDDKYDSLILLHRTPELNCKVCIKQWLCCKLPVWISNYFIKK